MLKETRESVESQDTGVIVYIIQIREQLQDIIGLIQQNTWPDFGKPTIYTQETIKIISSISSTLKYNFG